MTDNFKRIEKMIFELCSFYLRTSVKYIKSDAYIKLSSSPSYLNKIITILESSKTFTQNTKYKLYRTSETVLLVCDFEDERVYKEIVAVQTGLRLLELQKQVLKEKELYLEALKDLYNK